MGVNCFVFSFARKSCGIMNKMFDNIQPEEDTIKPKNGKLTICHNSLCFYPQEV
jgi:hypothetical protein